MKLTIPELSLVVLIGPSGSGKTVFARKHFLPTEVLSSDFCRALVADDENDQAATQDAFDVLHYVAGKRLAAGRITVVDATNVQRESRKPLVALARQYHCLPVAIVFNLPEKVCQERNRGRPERDFGPHVVRQQLRQLRRSLRSLKLEGFRHVWEFTTPEEIEAAITERQPLWNNLKQEHGPFDIIGDVHGCHDELLSLLSELGYEILEQPEGAAPAVRHPDGRRLIFLGDLVDRGPKITDMLRLVMGLVSSGVALCVPGNHDMKLVRALRGKKVQVTHGLSEPLRQLADEPPEFREQVTTFLDSLVSHYVLDDGKLVVAHAGMKQEMQGRGSGKVRDFALYGETTGETDDFGLPVRVDWAGEYRGSAMVVYGHMPIAEAEWLNRTIDIDTGCVFGGKLTALRYPERELVSVSSARTYYEPVRPLATADGLLPARASRSDDVLDIKDVTGKRIIRTRLHHNVTIREANACAALEVMSRFAVNPKWLVYLPPTMSPADTSREPGLLEHPAQAFAYYRERGVPRVVCEEKHMGSRAVIVICRDEDAARSRFGVGGEGIGACYTRTGRPFLQDRGLAEGFLARVRDAFAAADMWREFATDWFCLDCELMPWSVKAQELLRQQYAAVASASFAAMVEAVAVLDSAGSSNPDLTALRDRYRTRAGMTDRFAGAYRPYCWPVNSLSDLKLAPFHLLAAEGAVFADKDHVWHMETLARMYRADPELFVATAYRVVDLADDDSEGSAVGWWQELTHRGGEGMVAKPFDFIVKGRGGLLQPAIKCRGREYLRIIYGPEYTAPEHLERLRSRGLSAKRSLALREFALGIEALERFVRREPLYAVHECVFGVLALESEPVDPRL